MDNKRKYQASEKKKGQYFVVKEKIELMTFLMSSMPHKSRTKIKSLLTNRQILVDGHIVSQYNYPLEPGQRIEIRSERVAKEKKFQEYNIVYEDHDVIVIDKKAGLLSIATENQKQNTAYNLLSQHVKKQNPSNKIFVVHRLDRETSGLMVFAKSEEIKNKLQETWTDTVIERTYIAVVEGEIEKTEGTITSYLSEDKSFNIHSSHNSNKGKKAVTHYTTIKKNKEYSLLKVNLETGRKNQIRVHMKDIGHSIAGDKKYGAISNPMKRLGLHAQVLSFKHPSTNEEKHFETNIPRVFLRVFQ